MRKSIWRLILFMAFISALCACGSRAGEPPSRKDMEYSGENVRFFERTAKNNVYLQSENVGGMRESDILNKIREYELKLNVNAAEAKLDSVSWEVEQSEKTGKRVNAQKTLDAVLNAAEGSKVSLVIEEAKPNVSAQQLKNNIVLIGSYSTPLLDTQESRVNNIEIAAQKLNYKKLAPGDEFSFNSTIGRRTEAKGYEEAPIIIKTEDGPKKGKGVGGGICQLATTLYNAANKAGLEITERHEHSKDVGYVPDGKDATVSYGSVDLKFRNTRSHTVMIRAYVSGKALTVKIFENRN